MKESYHRESGDPDLRGGEFSLVLVCSLASRCAPAGVPRRSLYGTVQIVPNGRRRPKTRPKTTRRPTG
eukprot:9402269-Pyramimonas_sp.AAC.1